MVTGITGQLGRALVRKLTKDPDNHIIGLCRQEDILYASKLFSGNSQVICILAELGNKSLIKALVSLYRPNHILHFAANSSVFESNINPLGYFTVNVQYTLNFLEAVRESVNSSYSPKFINMSSIEIFGNIDGVLLESRNEDSSICPSNQYGVSKAAAHLYVDSYRNLYGLQASNLISANFVSEFQSSNFVLAKVFNYLSGPYATEKLKLGNISSIRDWSYVDDIVSGIEFILHNQCGNYCIASGNIFTVEEVIAKIFERFSISNYLDYIDIENKLIRIGDTNFVNIDCKKLKSLGWSPQYSIDQLIDKIFTNRKQKNGSN